MSELIVAIDARQIGAGKTGDSAYWLGLVTGLRQVATNERFLLISNVPRPAEIPESEQFSWIQQGGTNNRRWTMADFPAAVASFGAHVAHTQYSVPPRLKGRVVTTIHDVSPILFPHLFGFKDRLLFRLGLHATSRWAAKIITVSESSRREIEQVLPAASGKVLVTPNALPVTFEVQSREVAQQLVRERLGIEGPYLLTVGTQWERKNVGLAVAAAERLPEVLPHRLVIVGRTDQTFASPRIVTTGYVADDLIPALYAAADLYLAPSRHEGFGIPLLEAFASGCPVLCSRGGALPEVAGDAAEIASDFEAETWSGLVVRLLADSSKLAEMRERGWQRVRAFDWETAARRTLAIYHEVAGR